MALIPCTECGKQLSTRATHCPSCGAPGPAFVPAHKATQRNVRTVQQTGKGLKAWLLVFSALLLVGVIMLVIQWNLGVSSDKGPQLGSSLFLMGGSFIGVIVVKGIIWWQHG